ncbi:conserved membrane hypothetical protein [Candidatus Magnetomoraceae bacterium gMMP-1]
MKKCLTHILKLYCLLYMAPVRLSEEIILKIKENQFIKYFLFIILLQFPLIIAAHIIIVSKFNLQLKELFFYGELAGIILSLIGPFFLLLFVKEKKTWTGIKEAVLRGASFIFIFNYIGGFGSLILGKPEWNLEYYIFAAITGYFIINAQILIKVIHDIDQVKNKKNNDKKQDILINAVQLTKVNKFCYAGLSLFLLLFNLIVFQSQIPESLDNPFLFNPFDTKTICTFFLYVTLGMAFGAWISIGKILSHIIRFINSEIAFKYDELINLTSYKMIDPNPYNRFPVKTASELFGRDKLIKEIIQTLNKKPSPGYILVQGERRIGKTSLINVLEKHLNKQNINAVSFNTQFFGTHKDVDSNLQLLSILIKEYANKYDSKIVIPNNIKNFIDFFDNKRVIFLIDEFDAYLNKLSDKDKKFWESRHFINNDITFIFSAPISELRGLSTDLKNAMYGEHVFSLYPLTSDAVKSLIRNPVKGKLRYTSEAINEIISLTGGFPIYVQALCGQIIDFMNKKNSTSVVNKGLLQECLKQTHTSIPLLMISYIDLLSADEIKILNILKDQDNKLSITENIDESLKNAIQKLEEKFLVKVDKDYIYCTARFFLDKELLTNRRK